MSEDSRRGFLKSAAALGGTLVAAGGGQAQTSAAPLLPTVRFGKTNITRLIVGSNPLYGYSHFNRILDQHMREWYTLEKKLEVLKSCEQHGINTWQVHFNLSSMADFRAYREAGGKMNLVLLADFELMKEPAKYMPEAVKTGALGIAHHGNRTDERFRMGEKHLVKEFCKMVRDTGVMVGISTHNPGVVDIVESENWDIDYYMTCLYRVSRTPEQARQEFGEAPLGETFMEKDPERMTKMVRATKRPCLAFKMLGAGRNINGPDGVEKAFRYAYSNIKPGDAAIIGMYPRFRDEVKENTELVRKILA
jgi:hypothetical protein